MVKVYGWRRVEGYNPPNLYKQFRFSSQVDTFKDTSDYYSDVQMSVQNRLGTIDIATVPESPLPPWDGATVLLIEDYGYMSYMCNVVTSELISEDVIRFTYDIDWYTSYVITSLYYGTVGGRTHEVPVADRIMYLRRTDGAIKHTADGFQPRYTEYSALNAKRGAGNEYMFVQGNDSVARHKLPLLLAYHDSNPSTFEDTIHWIVSYNRTDGVLVDDPEYTVFDTSVIPPKWMWEMYLKMENAVPEYVAGRGFNPKGVLYFGWINVDPELLDFQKTGNVTKVVTPSSYQASDVQFTSDIGSMTEWMTAGAYAYYPIGNYHSDTYRTFKPFDGNNSKATEYDRYQLLDIDGTILHEVPMDMKLGDMIVQDVDFNYDATNPGLVFTVSYVWEVTFTDVRTFTIPFRQLDFFLDNEQIYNVEEKVYARELRNQQTMDNLVSGLTGAVTTGVTVYGFSRNTRSKKDMEEGTKSGTRKYQGGGDAGYKGMLGGGIAAAGALATFAYDSLYANQRYADIEQKHQSVIADANLMTATAPFELMYLCGFWKVSFDASTIAEIQKFQIAYGYPDRTMESDKQLNTITGYVQADLILKGGMTKVAEDYVCSMFSNGVRFT